MHTTDTCVRVDDAAQVLVDVEPAAGGVVQLLYLMELEGDDWRVAGAAPAGGDGEDSGPVI